MGAKLVKGVEAKRGKEGHPVWGVQGREDGKVVDSPGGKREHVAKNGLKKEKTLLERRAEEGRDRKGKGSDGMSLGLPPWPQDIILYDILGRGSFGTVFLAKREAGSEPDNSSFHAINRAQSSRSVSLRIGSDGVSTLGGVEAYAVKRIRKKTLSSASLRDVMREIDIHYALSRSINVIYIYGAYEDERYVYIVLELCSGGVLYDRIQAGNYSEKIAAGYVRSMLRVLAQCHGRGIVYRDLKPDNFLFLDDTADSPLKATDFGLATYFTQDETLSAVTGTPYYMAPEVIKGCYSKEADLWSLGVVVYQLLTGKLPFTHDYRVSGKAATIQVLRSVLRDKIEIDDSRLFDHVSDSGKDLLKKLLCRNPMSRLTAEEALEHPWVREEDGKAPSRSLSGTIIQRLQHFGTYGWLKRYSLFSMIKIMREVSSPEKTESKSSVAPSSRDNGGETMAIDQLNELNDLNHYFLAQKDEISNLFNKIDKDENGKLDFNEMKEAMFRLKFRLSEDELEQLFQEMDIDRSGEINYEEFMATVFNWSLVAKQSQWLTLCRQVFQQLDKDKSGFVSADEVKQTFVETTGETDEDFSNAISEEMMKKIDRNGDGLIDFSEFVHLLGTCAQGDYSIYATARSFQTIRLLSELDIDTCDVKDDYNCDDEYENVKN